MKHAIKKSTLELLVSTDLSEVATGVFCLFCLIFSFVTLTACGKSEYEFKTPASTPIDMTAPDALHSKLEADADGVADGVDEVIVTLTFKNAKGTGVSGITPKLAMSGEGNTVMPCSVSDSGGISQCRLMSSIPGQKEVTIQQPVKMNTWVTFRIMASPPVLFGVSSTGDMQTLASTTQIISSGGGIPSEVSLLSTSGEYRFLNSHLAVMLSMEQ